MRLWDYLDRVGERRTRVRLAHPQNLRVLANVIGCALVSGFLGALGALFIIPIPPENKELIIYMLGQLSGFAGGIVAYHYTSKAGEREMEVQRADNTGKAFEAIRAAQEAPPPPTKAVAAAAAEQVADAAEAEADAIRQGEPR
jgi:hypothetical protein